MWTKFVFRYLGPEYEKQLSSVDVRYLLSISLAIGRYSEDPPVQGRKGFVNFLRVMDYRWADWMHKLELPPWGKRLSEDENRLFEADARGVTGKKGGLEPVAGFWLFPIDSFGDIDEFRKSIEDQNGSNAGEIEWRPKLVKDLSQFQPKLGVYHLS